MAVAVRRPGFRLWIAWFGAGALGAAAAAVASRPGSGILSDTDSSYWGPIVLAMPLALLQFVVLRGVAGMSVAGAGLWFGATTLAAAADAFALNGWYVLVQQLMQRLPIPVEIGSDVMFSVGDYINPLLVGLAQGMVLAWVLRRRLVGVLWIAGNLVAFACAFHLMGFAFAAGFDPGAQGGYVLALVAFAALYAAVTGLALIMIWRVRRPVAAPPLPRPAV